MALNPEAQLQRLLVMIPWIMREDGPTVAEVCERFAIAESELAATLDLLFLCGLYPFTPDQLIEAEILDDRVWIRSADQFADVPKLSPAEALALVTTGQAALSLEQNGDNETLRRAISKLTVALGVTTDMTDIAIRDEELETIPLLRRAIDDHHIVEMTYYSYGRNAMASRRIAPLRIFENDGRTYVLAIANVGETTPVFRTFRCDRMHGVIAQTETFDVPEEIPDVRLFTPTETHGNVVLRVKAASRWMLERVPHEVIGIDDDGTLTAQLVVSASEWLDRFLLQLGKDAEVVTGEATVAQTGQAILARYADHPDD